MDFKDILDYCKAEAIYNTLEPNEESVWRSICRSYSKTFNTPLKEVLSLDPEFVMISVFEEQLEDFDQEKDLEGLLDTIYMLEDPTYESQKKDELEDFIKDAEKQEEERIKAGKPIHKALKGEPTLKSPEPLAELPKSGGINLSYLEREENPLSKFED